MKYYVKRGYFGKGGKVYISTFRAWIYRIFTDISIFIEKDKKEIWVNKPKGVK